MSAAAAAAAAAADDDDDDEYLPPIRLNLLHRELALATALHVPDGIVKKGWRGMMHACVRRRCQCKGEVKYR
jgi:hypothetical protein